MSSSNCCFLTCIWISQEAGQVVWYSYLFQNFPEFIVIHTVKGFGIVNKAEIDVCWNSLAFSMIQQVNYAIVVQLLGHVQLFVTPWLQHARPPCPSLSPGIWTRTIFIYKSKENRSYVILQNVGQYICTIVAHFVCSCFSTTQNPELEWERKQENGLLALLGNNSSLCKNLLHPYSMRGRT